MARPSVCPPLYKIRHLKCFVSFRYVSLRFVSLRYVSFRYVSLRYVSFRSLRYVSFRYVTFRFVPFRSPHLFYLLTVGVEVIYFHLITPKYTAQSVGLLWMRDRSVAEISTWQQKHSQETNIYAPGGIRTNDPSKRSAADLRLRPRGHWDRPFKMYDLEI
jgi:hypothetical protein